MDIEEDNSIQIYNEAKDGRYIVLSESSDCGYKTDSTTLKVFDIKEKAYKAIDVPNKYLEYFI